MFIGHLHTHLHKHAGSSRATSSSTKETKPTWGDLQWIKDLKSLEPICVIKGEIFQYKSYLFVPVLKKGNIIINPRSNNDFHFQVFFFSCLNVVLKAVGATLVKVGKVQRKSGETGELAHKQGLGIFHMHTPEEFLHYCADTDVLRYDCGKKKLNFHKNSSCSTDRCTAGDAWECLEEKWMIS